MKSCGVRPAIGSILYIVRSRTQSEALLEAYCNERRYPFTSIEPVPGAGRFPDYEVVTPQGPVICEVKQIDPNDEDKDFDLRLVTYGHADSSRASGKRARAALKDACGQLRRFRDDPRPCIAVIVDTTYRNLDPSDIDAAMFGDPIVLFPLVPGDGRVEFTHGGNRRLTEKQGLYVGAVAVLARTGHLDVYHNPYAQKRVSTGCFPDLRDRHFMKQGHPDETGHGWSEYVGRRENR